MTESATSPATESPASAAVSDDAATASDDLTAPGAVEAIADKPDTVKRIIDAERNRAKEARKRADAAEAKVKEYEDANASDLDKAAAKAEKAEKARLDAEAKLLRYEIATAKAVPADAIDLLTATTREALEAQADSILALAKSATDAAASFDGGARTPAAKEQTPEEAHADFLGKLLGGPASPSQ